MEFNSKKIVVIGAGIEGVSSVKYLVSQGAEVTLVDKRAKAQIDSEKLKQIESLDIRVVFGDNYLSDLSSFDLVLRSPGVRPDLPQLEEAASKGIIVTSQTKLFFDPCPASIIGVTGTKGKGTTSSLIYDILKKAGKDVYLGGNIGVPPLEFIDKLTSNSIVVLELSSFQLIDLEKSPHIAVVLMVTSEHLDWHKDEDEYLQAKVNIVKHQIKNDFVVINKDFEKSRKIGESSAAKKYYFSTKEKVEKGAYLDHDFITLVTNGWTTIIKKNEIQIPGEHNLQNVVAAVATAAILEIQPGTIANAVKSFKCLPHRLEFVREVYGVRYYNDSASTTPETAVAAISAFKEPKIVILGGSSKESDFTYLGRIVIETGVKSVILIGEEAERIKNSIKQAGNFRGQSVEGLNSMNDLVQKAKELSQPGDIVILSPACASFDMFKNYQDRGDQFKEAVKNL